MYMYMYIYIYDMQCSRHFPHCLLECFPHRYFGGFTLQCEEWTFLGIHPPSGRSVPRRASNSLEKGLALDPFSILVQSQTLEVVTVFVNSGTDPNT